MVNFQMLAKLTKVIAAFIGGVFVVAYVFLFLPALVYIPLMGVFAFDMSIWGGILCILGLIAIPLSMPASIYFIFSTYSQRSYLKMFFFCILPAFFCIASMLFTSLIMRLHT